MKNLISLPYIYMTYMIALELPASSDDIHIQTILVHHKHFNLMDKWTFQGRTMWPALPPAVKPVKGQQTSSEPPTMEAKQ